MFETTMRAARGHFWLAGAGAVLLSACGGGGDDPAAREDALARPSYSVGGTIALDAALAPGPSGSISLDLQGGDYVESFPVTGSGGPFTFNKPLFNRDTYNVNVRAAVGGYTCSVTGGGSGTIMRSDVTGVEVACVLIPKYDVPVSVTGLPADSSVVIQNNGALNRVTATGNGLYVFPFKQYAETNYSVTIVTQPTGASCTVPLPVGVVKPDMSPLEVTCVIN